MIKKLSNLYKKYKEIINYLIVGGLTTVVSIASYYVVKQFIFRANTQFFIQVSTVVSWVLAVLFDFFTNKKYVFESDKKGMSLAYEMVKFFASRLATLGIEMFCMFLFTKPFHINDKISKILVQPIIVVLNYVFSKLFVFKKHK